MVKGRDAKKTLRKRPRKLLKKKNRKNERNRINNPELPVLLFPHNFGHFSLRHPVIPGFRDTYHHGVMVRVWHQEDGTTRRCCKNF